jgi:hypothetical protein
VSVEGEAPYVLGRGAGSAVTWALRLSGGREVGIREHRLERAYATIDSPGNMHARGTLGFRSRFAPECAVAVRI